MDAFKLLTRSTKFKTGPSSSSASLPSTGKAENPQLFRNSEAEKLLEEQKNGKKRKRGSAADEPEEREPNLDFFSSNKGSSKKVVKAEEAPSDEERGSGSEDEDEMDEVQRRTILNSHKIKVTDMRELEEIQPVQAQGEEEPKKKKKKRKQKEEPAQTLTKKEQKKARRLFPRPLVSFKELRTQYKISRRLAENIAEQGFTIVNEGRKLVSGTGVKITLMKKGMQVVEREDDDEDVLDEGSSESSESEDDEKTTEKKSKGKAPVTKSDILVTTPLQLVNALSANKTKPMATLPLVRNIVLDEADVLLDPLFREQTLDIWRACTHPELRASLWSATMGSSIEDLAKSTIKERKDASSLTKSYPLYRLVVGLKDSAIPNIQHKLVYAATEQGKLLGLRQLLHPAAAAASDIRLRPPFLIFTQTIPRAVALHSELRYDIPPEAGGSSRIAVLHSDLSDGQRSEIMKNFRKGEIWILVTTDLLARGIDFRGINGVVNYDIPNSAAVYVHRVGRTGRAGREGGVAVTYYTKEDIPYVKSIANVIDVSEKLRGTEGEKSVQKWLLDSLPDLSKKDKKELKKHGVRARQTNLKSVADDKQQRKTRISTKSGFERRMENKKKGAIAASRNRKLQGPSGAEPDSGDDGWGGIQE
ncbi:hypothetical protein AFLA_003904 [Aspergillus flavus NRRL3357]|nr:hypothetical protein AFLA_003904 [Aspergillus flavus NRRL3357]